MRKRFALLAIPLLLSCQDSNTGPTRTDLGRPDAAIIDGRPGHSGNPHFFWLHPQWTSGTTFTGQATTKLFPVLKVCRWDKINSTCIGADVATLQVGDGTLTPKTDEYVGVWNTYTANPVLEELFRARVYLGEYMVGARDLKFVTKSVFGQTPNNNVDWAPVHYDPNDVGSNRPSGKYTFRFRLEVGALSAAVNGDEPCGDCTEGSVDNNATTTTVIETPSDDAAAVFPAGSVNQDINVLVERLERGCLETDLQQYDACYRFTTIPDITFQPGQVHVEVCLESLDDFSVGQVQLHRQEEDENGEPTGTVTPLENVADQFINCAPPVIIGALARKFPTLARGMRAVTKPLARVLGPKFAYAEDEGRGGRTDSFSRVGWARGVSMTPVSSSNLSGNVGSTLAPAVVQVGALHFHPGDPTAAAGVPVQFQLTGPAGSSSGSVTTDELGKASIPVVLNKGAGAYTLSVTAPGTNITNRAVPSALFNFTAVAADPPPSIAIVPLSPTGVGNCIPFGQNNNYFGTGSDVSHKFQGFIYRDVPAFVLRPGDKIAFDLGSLNDVDVRRSIFLSATNANPALSASTASQGIKAVAWTKVVDESATPLNPKGNTISGDYELVYTAIARFEFAGGGLAIGFQGSPPASYVDGGCEQVLVLASYQDASNRFYRRFYDEPDQSTDILDDHSGINYESIGGFKIYAGDASPPKAFIAAPMAARLNASLNASPFNASVLVEPAVGSAEWASLQGKASLNIGAVKDARNGQRSVRRK